MEKRNHQGHQVKKDDFEQKKTKGTKKTRGMFWFSFSFVHSVCVHLGDVRHGSCDFDRPLMEFAMGSLWQRV